VSEAISKLGVRSAAVTGDVTKEVDAVRVVEAMHAAGQNIDEIATADGASLCRAGHPDEIAGPLVFLVSDLASFMSGQTLIVDGGTRAAFPHRQGTSTMPRGTGQS
jgi:NAD(P)-dependent dehydrogenase (short-subunit alcohol dehydrogenase family)